VPVVDVTLLGGFGATVDGARVPDRAWRLKKGRELVKLLALARGHRLHREQVIDVLWRDREPSAAANNLYQALHAARRALTPEAIELRDEIISLTADVDVDRFEAAAAAARRAGTAAAYRAALALYAGELLPENRYDDWADARRDELAAAAETLQEGIDSVGADRPFVLPSETSSFVGRGRELGELSSLLRRTRLLTLSGTGGAGKTRLALELARAVQTAYAGGAVFVELASVREVRLVAEALADALDVRALSAQDVADAVIDFVRPRTLLLVLDNCEHVLESASVLADLLLRSAPDVTIVVTSREPLRLTGEIVFRVPSLGLPDPQLQLPPERLLEYEAVSLFAERAQAVAAGFELSEANAADVVRICYRLDGLPLALELAAGRVGALGVAAIAGRLDDRFGLLRSGSLAAPTRQQTLQAALDWSHDLLDDEEAALFRRLAIFAGGFELESVEEVCADDSTDALVADVLGRLVEKSLVAVEDGRGERRYRLLETVRVYARDRLVAAHEDERLADVHAQWALSVARREQYAPSLDRESANLAAALRVLLDRHPHGALEMCAALLPFWLRRIELEEARRRIAEALAACRELSPLRSEALLAAAAIEFRSGTLSRGETFVEESRALAAEIGDAQREWRALEFFGEFALAVDDAEAAAERLERALALARRTGFTAGEAISVHSLAVAAWTAGDLEQADTLVASSIGMLRDLEQSLETIPSPVNIAEIRMEVPGRPVGPRLLFEDTLQPFVEVSCGAAVGYALANRAGIARARGNVPLALALLAESEARFVRAGDDQGVATALVRRAYTYLGDGDVDAAHAQLERALELRDGLGDRRGRGLVLAGLGLVEIVAGRHSAAERHLSEARDVFRRAGDRWGLAAALWRSADLAIVRGNLDDAEAYLSEAYEVLRETQRDRWLGNTLLGLAEVAALRGDLGRASDLLTEARERHVARADGQGVATVEARIAELQRTRKGDEKPAPIRLSPTRRKEMT